MNWTRLLAKRMHAFLRHTVANIFSATIYQRAAVAVGVAYVSLQLAVYFELPTIV